MRETEVRKRCVREREKRERWNGEGRGEEEEKGGDRIIWSHYLLETGTFLLVQAQEAIVDR